MNQTLKHLKPKIVRLLKKHHVVRAGIFGSYARGEQTKRSDIDILVDISDDTLSLLGFIRIKHELEEALGKNVDLVEYAALKSRIKERILKEELVIL